MNEDGGGYDDVDFKKLFEELDADEEMLDDVFNSSSEEDEEIQSSRKGKAPNKDRPFLEAYMIVTRNYFRGPDSVYDEFDFENRFRCPRSVFNRIHDAMMGTDPFIQKYDCRNKPGIHPLVKLVGCFRHIAYGDACDRDDENLSMSSSSLRVIVKQFTVLMKEKFGDTYLNRCPNQQERGATSSVMRSKGFPGCLGSWDCKHFTWQNCPLRFAGHHSGHGTGSTLILEAIADHRKYLWHVNFGDAGAMNDLNVLDKSSIVAAMLLGVLCLKTHTYMINGSQRDWMYFLVDGVYPEWAIFVSAYSNPKERNKKRFAGRQERVRKDIECAFGIVVQRFHVLKRPLRNWYLDELINLVHCCVIIHNMIVEEREGGLVEEIEEEEVNELNSFPLFGKEQISEPVAAADGIDLFAARVAAFETGMQSSWEHYQLRRDLVEHVNRFLDKK